MLGLAGLKREFVQSCCLGRLKRADLAKRPNRFSLGTRIGLFSSSYPFSYLVVAEVTTWKLNTISRSVLLQYLFGAWDTSVVRLFSVEVKWEILSLDFYNILRGLTRIPTTSSLSSATTPQLQRFGPNLGSTFWHFSFHSTPQSKISNKISYHKQHNKHSINSP